MRDKPAHLATHYAGQFRDATVVEAYRHRVPYPDAVASLLLGLTSTSNPHVLEIGCGPGQLTRLLATHGASVHAIDASAPMLAYARAHHDGLGVRWEHAGAETFEARRPYELIVAAESLHWTEWGVALPRLADALAPGGVLAIVERRRHEMAWSARLQELISRRSTNQEYRPYDLVEELRSRALFVPQGRTHTPTREVTQRVDDYIESWHSRNGLSRERMGREDAHAFDAELRELLMEHSVDGRVTFEVFVEIIWGAPLALR